MIVIGHRGACGYETENTIASFQKAIELGADYVEFDVQKTRDDAIVVFHDQKVSNKGLVVDMTLGSLRREMSKARVSVPTLDEVFEFINGRIGMNIEIKSRMPCDCLAEKIRRHRCDPDQVIVSSFMHECLLEMHEVDPGIKTGILLKERAADVSELLRAFSSRTIIQKYACVDQDFVDTVHGAGAQVFVWTVNEPKDIKRMLGLGVDGIISDFPDRVREMLGSRD